MSKFFVQMVLSVLVAVSAAIGFSPNVRNEVHKTLGEAKSLVHEMKWEIFHTVKNVDADAEIATKAEGESAVNSDVDVDLNLIANQASEKSAETNIESALSAESETEAAISSNNGSLNLEHELETDLELDLGIRK